MKKIIIALSVILILFLLFFLVLILKKSDIQSFLEKSSKVNADLLIIESWLPDPAIELAKKEIKNGNYKYIVTTGIQSSELDFCMVAENGFLIFYPGFGSGSNDSYNQHKIGIVARSKMGGIYCSHFNVYVNDSLVADFNADEEPRKYEVTWEKPLVGIDSVMIEFTNDYLDENGDRNLYVREIIIDDNMVIPYQFNSVFDIGKLGGTNRIVNNYRSLPDVIRNKLISEGIDSLKIASVTGGRSNVNRTLKGALAFRNWLEKSGHKITGVNIVSMSIHSRRTWLTYKHVLDRSYKIGIISLPYFESPDQERSELLDTLIEFIDLIYYRIILIPY